MYIMPLLNQKGKNKSTHLYLLYTHNAIQKEYVKELNVNNRRAWRAIVHRVAKSQTWLKQLSRSSMQALSKMSSFQQQQKITRHAKKQESVIHICKKKKVGNKNRLWEWLDVGHNKKIFQSRYYKYVHRTKGKLD